MFFIKDYCHPADLKALNDLKAVPGFPLFVKAFMKIFAEAEIRGEAFANHIQLGPNQLPEIYNLLPPICEQLGIQVPELFIEGERAPNAYTYGDTKPIITVSSGLVETFSLDEIKTVLAHECGHIACHHVLYSTMADYLKKGLLSQMGEWAGMLSMPLEYALLYWSRCSEYSADRAAALCLNDEEIVINTMMRLSGMSKTFTEKMNRDAYLQQLDEYNNIYSNKVVNKTFQALMIMDSDHPFLVVRANELKKWINSQEFKNAIHSDVLKLTESKVCPKCGNPVSDDWGFCQICGEKLK